MNTDLTEKQRDSLRRILGMSENDIMDMPYEYMLELIDNFESEFLIREVVARGHSKAWQINITQRLQAVYERWINYMDFVLRNAYIQEGHAMKMEELFKSINYDIHSNCLIKPYQDPRLPPLEFKPINNIDLDDVTSHLLEQDNEELQEENEQLTEENKKLKKRNAALNEENAKLNKENAALNEENAKLNKENAALNEENAKLNRENAALNEENAKLNKENAALNEENAKLLQQLREQSIANNTIPRIDNTAEIIEQLKPIFWSDEEQIKSFLDKIRGKKNTAVIAVIADGVIDRTISEQSCRRDLWSVLKKNKLYQAGESAYNLALNKALAECKQNKGL